MDCGVMSKDVALVYSPQVRPQGRRPSPQVRKDLPGPRTGPRTGLMTILDLM